MDNKDVQKRGESVAISLVHPFHNGNHGRDTGDYFRWFAGPADLAQLAVLFVPGFQDNQGFPGLFPLTPDQQKLALEEREADLRMLQENRESFDARLPDGKRIPISATDRLRAYQELFAPGGKLIKPKFGVVYGNRRCTAIPVANAIRFKLGLEPITEIVANIREYGSEIEMMEACILENTLKVGGFRPLGLNDYIHSGIRMYLNSQSDIRFREIFRPVKGVDGQKMYALCQLICQYPDLHIFEQIKAGVINFAKLDKERMRALYNEKASENDVKEYIYSEKAKDPAKKISSKKDIEAVSRQSNNMIGRELAEGFMKNDIGNWNAKYAGSRAKYINTFVKALLDVNFASKAMAFANELEKEMEPPVAVQTQAA